jgi:hypothetical protein
LSRTNGGRRALDDRLALGCCRRPARTFAVELAVARSAFPANLVDANFARSFDTPRSGEDARTHIKGAQRPADGGSDICRRNAGIHSQSRSTAVPQHNSAVNDHGLANVDHDLTPRDIKLDEPRREKGT